MKLAVLHAVGHLDYCDPDIYPVARGAPVENAEARLPQIRADRAAFAAVLAFEHLDAAATLTPEQEVAINEDYKQIQAIDLRPSGGSFAFTVYVPSQSDPAGNASISGTVDRSGLVRLDPPNPGRAFACPICLAAGDLIATPSGPVMVQRIRVGMPVFTTDAAGRRIVGRVLRIVGMLAPVGHEIVRLALADGRTLEVSPGHPTADGRRVGDLEPGDRLDGSVVRAVALVPYGGGRTFDLLASGPTGTYFADGILLGSTLTATAGGSHASPNDRSAEPIGSSTSLVIRT